VAFYVLEITIPDIRLPGGGLDCQSLLAALGFIRDYKLWPIIGFFVPFVVVLYLFLFEGVARLVGRLPLPFLTFQWSVPTFWYDAKVYHGLVDLAAYSSKEVNNFKDLADLHSSYLDHYRRERLERYTSYTAASQHRFRQCLFAMQLSLLFAFLVACLFLLKSLQASLDPWIAIKTFLLLAASGLLHMALRYEGERMVEQQIQAECAFVVASLNGDPEAKPGTEAELKHLERKIAQLMVMPQPYISQQGLWISRHLGRYRLVRWLLGKRVYGEPDEITLRLLLHTAGTEFVEQLSRAGFQPSVDPSILDKPPPTLDSRVSKGTQL